MKSEREVSIIQQQRALKIILGAKTTNLRIFFESVEMFNFPHIKYFIEWGKKNYRTFFPCEKKIDKLLSLIIKTDLRRLKMRSILNKNVSRKMNSTEQIVENTLTVRVNV